MHPYEPSRALIPFGLNNTGVICYLNAFLQTLSGCTAFIEAVLRNKEYLHRTRTGAAVYRFISARANVPAHASMQSSGMQSSGVHNAAYTSMHVPDQSGAQSSDVLHALVQDLRERRPNDRFGGGQESASEALTFLLEMMEVPSGLSGVGEPSEPSEITNLFKHRFRCELHCKACGTVVSSTTEYAVNFNLFHIDDSPPSTAEEFSKIIRVHSSTTEDYTCEKCPCWSCSGKVVECAVPSTSASVSTGTAGTTTIERRCESCGKLQKKCIAVRIYKLALVPEIIFCMFNAYGRKIARFFPDEFNIPSISGGDMVYQLVGQIEHSGGLGGGHYWARGLRAGGKVYLFNDTSVSPTRFDHTPNTYIIAYNYTTHRI